ncbi:threonylcarbamoyl-AMP synthase [Candidatus Microgenomates bacterium]|nr:threonylcarbamoyl-AMP synthase [Candidatus Microgenomates bacterium]
MKNNLSRTITILKNGGVVIFPTDTVWGVGCRIDNVKSVSRVYQIRKRPLEKALPVLVSSLKQAKEYFDNVTEETASLLTSYWPGGLTVVYYANGQKVLPEVRGGGITVGLRMPNKQDLLEVIKKVGVPLLGPSANFSSEKTPTKKSELDPELLKLVDYVMEGECDGNMSSTVIDCTKKPWEILRQGAVKIDPKYLQKH